MNTSPFNCKQKYVCLFVFPPIYFECRLGRERIHLYVEAEKAEPCARMAVRSQSVGKRKVGRLRLPIFKGKGKALSIEREREREREQ